MYVLVDERDHVIKNVVSRFKQEGLCVGHIEPADFAEWIGALQAVDVKIIEGFIIGKTEEQLRFPKLIRQRSDAPILCLREGVDLSHTVSLLAAGADDVVHMEIHPLEVLARSDAISRRARAGASDDVNIGELRIYFDGRLPEFAGKMLDLTRREQRILEYLARNRLRYVSKSQIFNSVYGLFEYHTDERTIESHICKLRKKLVESLGFDPIQTRRYLGYMLSGAQVAVKAADRTRPAHHLSLDTADACAA